MAAQAFSMHNGNLTLTSGWPNAQFTDGLSTPLSSPRARSNARMYDSPISAASPEQQVQIDFTPPPAPSKFWKAKEIEEDMKAALSCRCAILLSWALQPYKCCCSIDHSVHAAISSENPEALEMLLSGGTLNHMLHVTCGGQTPLHKAVRMAHEDGDIGCAMSNLLLARGTSVDAKNADGEASIHTACRTCSLPSVKLLLQHGADSNFATSSSKTPLHILCQRLPPCTAEELSILEELLAYGAAPALLDADGLRPCDHISKQDIAWAADPFKLAMRDLLVGAEQQWIRDERWHARRSCLFLRARLESGHIISQLSAELLKAVVRNL